MFTFSYLLNSLFWNLVWRWLLLSSPIFHSSCPLVSGDLLGEKHFFSPPPLAPPFSPFPILFLGSPHSLLLFRPDPCVSKSLVPVLPGVYLWIQQLSILPTLLLRGSRELATKIKPRFNYLSMWIRHMPLDGFKSSYWENRDALPSVASLFSERYVNLFSFFLGIGIGYGIQHTAYGIRYMVKQKPKQPS